MESIQLKGLKRWFNDYTRCFLTGDPALDSPVRLKIEHTTRVCENICRLGKSISLSEDQLTLAEAIGLLHDIGRFFQYQRYGTFNDQQSANHAVLGIRVIDEKRLLEKLPTEEKSMVIDAIRFHNAPSLPRNKPLESKRFMKLIRDADKLDIWKVFADYYRNGQTPDAAIVQHLASAPGCGKAIIGAILDKRMANFKDMKTINDFRLLQLSWVFDINFPATSSIAAQRGDLNVIARALPDEYEVNRAVACVMDQLDNTRSAG